VLPTETPKAGESPNANGRETEAQHGVTGFFVSYYYATKSECHNAFDIGNKTAKMLKFCLPGTP
jgi:hypothetical protein